MIVKQVTVRVENREGKLKEVMDILGKENINVEALSMADTVTRLILPNPEQVAEILRQPQVSGGTDGCAPDPDSVPGRRALGDAGGFCRGGDQSGIYVRLCDGKGRRDDLCGRRMWRRRTGFS